MHTQAAAGSEIEMQKVGELEGLLSEGKGKLRAKPCSTPDCGNDAKFRCEVKIMCSEYGCKRIVCDDCRNQIKICGCIDQKEKVCCVDCEEKVRSQAGKWNFFIPSFLFIIINIAVWFPLTLSRLSDL